MNNDNIEKDDILDTYGIYFERLKNKNLDICPSPEQLILYFNEELSGEEKERIEDHIDLCPLCLTALERLYHADKIDQDEIILPENWKELETTIDEDFYDYLETASVSEEKMEESSGINWIEILKLKWKKFLNSFFAQYKIAYTGALAFVVIFSLYTYAYLSRPDYFNLAQIEPERTNVFRSMSTTTNDFNTGLKLYEQEKYEKAVLAFDTYLKENPNQYEANYYAGLSYLFHAKKRFLGFPCKFNKAEVENGMKYLKRALRLSQDNQFYQEDCYWYIGKAYLMKSEFDRAKEQFDKILFLSQPNLMRKKEAKEIISKIANLKE